MSEEIAVVVENRFTGTLAPVTCSLHYYRISESPTRQTSRSRSLNSSLFDICCDIEKKMDDILEEFKTAMIGINGRLDVLQFQINCLSSNLPVHVDAFVMPVSAPVSDSAHVFAPAPAFVPEFDSLMDDFMNYDIPSDVSHLHTHT